MIFDHNEQCAQCVANGKKSLDSPLIVNLSSASRLIIMEILYMLLDNQLRI